MRERGREREKKRERETEREEKKDRKEDDIKTRKKQISENYINVQYAFLKW